MGKNVDISNQKLTIASASPATPLKLGEYNLLPSKTNLRFIPCAKPIVEKKKSYLSPDSHANSAISDPIFLPAMRASKTVITGVISQKSVSFFLSPPLSLFLCFFLSFFNFAEYRYFLLRKEYI